MRFSCFPPSAESESSTLEMSDPMAAEAVAVTAAAALALLDHAIEAPSWRRRCLLLACLSR